MEDGEAEVQMIRPETIAVAEGEEEARAEAVRMIRRVIAKVM